MDGTSFFQALEKLAREAFPVKGNGSPLQAKMMDRLMTLWLEQVGHYPEDAYGLTVGQFRTMAIFKPSDEDAKFDFEKFPEWLDRYKPAFLERVKFIKTRVIYPQQRWKHWLKKEATDRQVEAKSKAIADSIFYWPVTPQMVEEWMWLCMGEFTEAFLARNPRYFYLKANRPIGASDGKPVEFICLDVDFAGGTAHAYPIPESGVGDKSFLIDLEANGIVIQPSLDNAEESP